MKTHDSFCVQEWDRNTFLGNQSTLDKVFKSDSKLWWIGSVSNQDGDIAKFIESFRSGNISELEVFQCTKQVRYYVIAGESVRNNRNNLILIKTDSEMEIIESIESVVEVDGAKFTEGCGAPEAENKLTEVIGNRGLFIWRNIGHGFLKAVFGFGKK